MKNGSADDPQLVGQCPFTKGVYVTLKLDIGQVRVQLL